MAPDREASFYEHGIQFAYYFGGRSGLPNNWRSRPCLRQFVKCAGCVKDEGDAVIAQLFGKRQGIFRAQTEVQNSQGDALSIDKGHSPRQPRRMARDFPALRYDYFLKIERYERFILGQENVLPCKPHNGPSV